MNQQLWKFIGLKRQEKILTVHTTTNRFSIFEKVDFKKYSITILLGLMMMGCTTINHNSTAPLPIQSNQNWLVLPFVNNSEAPHAGDSAASITTGLLRTQGVKQIAQYIPSNNNPTVILQREIDTKQITQLIDHASKDNIRYVVTGTVNEWRYKAGLDGEPAVGITLQIIDTQTHQVIWSSVASGTGWGRSSVSDLAQKLVKDAISNLHLR